jgi:hypothetical protein
VRILLVAATSAIVIAVLVAPSDRVIAQGQTVAQARTRPLISFVTLAKGQGVCGGSFLEETVIYESSAWAFMLNYRFGNTPDPNYRPACYRAVPAVDFRYEMVVAVFSEFGLANSLTITRIERARGGIVFYSLGRLPPLPKVPTVAFHVVKTGRSDIISTFARE